MDYHKIILSGNASTNARIQKSLKGDVSFMSFGLAVKNSKGHTSYFPIVAFGKQGDSLVTYVTKGRQVLVEGHIEMGVLGRFNVVAEHISLGVSPDEPKEIQTKEEPG